MKSLLFVTMYFKTFVVRDYISMKRRMKNESAPSLQHD
jgi:hypothetical protein